MNFIIIYYYQCDLCSVNLKPLIGAMVIVYIDQASCSFVINMPIVYLQSSVRSTEEYGLDWFFIFYFLAIFGSIQPTVRYFRHLYVT